jgi:ribosomal-protein-alanine N-acetyltransferase
MILREYREEDLEKLYEIDNICFARGIAYTKMELTFFIQARNSFTLVAEDEGRGGILGFIVARRLRKNIGHFVTIDVLPEHRNRGVGSRLLTAAEATLRDNGTEIIYLETAVNNAPAIHFYQKHGYTIIDRIIGYYKGGLDAYLMRKDEG